MKKLYVLIVTILSSTFAFAQHETDKWYFGMFAGLDFTSGSPVPVDNGALYTTEGCASISDPSGNLLFYTDGVTIWNKDHQIMPNGTGLFGDVSTTQSALIVPLPGSSSQYYYIFTLAPDGGAQGFCYSIVDITLQGGLGDVTTKNQLIETHMTERMAAELHSNGIDYWIVTHKWSSNAFYAYTLTTSGLNMTPVISNVGIVHTDSMIQNTYGQMKFSTCYDKLVVATGYLDTVEIFDFDPSTGVVADPITLPIDYHVYGVEFSPDGNILYVSNYDPYHTLLQFDISSGDASTILSTKLAISNAPDIYALQLGPDQKIYVCRAWSSYLGVVSDPNVPGANCNYSDNGLNLDPNYFGHISALGLPGFMQSFFRGKDLCLPTTVNELPLENGIVYPNPSSGEFTLSLASFDNPQEVVISDLHGKTVERYTSFPGNEISLGEKLPRGMYTIHVKDISGVRMIKMLKL